METSRRSAGVSGLGAAGLGGSGSGCVALGIGEGLARLTAQGRERLEQTRAFRLSFGGAELNVMIALGRLGHRTRWVTRVPANALGRTLVRHATGFGVDVVAQHVAGGRLGLYFVELGSAPRPAEVLYDRGGSAASELALEQFDWPAIVRDTAVVHSTGITLALGPGTTEALAAAFGAAHAAGAVTSFDVNFRSRMWKASDAGSSYREILPLVDILFASPQDLELILERRLPTDVAVETLMDEYGLRQVFVRSTESRAHGTVRTRVELFGEQRAAGEWAEANPIDPFGAGDVAAAVCLDGLIRGQDATVMATRAARGWAHMHSIPGDAWIGGPEDLEDGGHTGRRILR